MNKSANFWDHRFGQASFVYGTKPNEWFKEQIDKLDAGKLLLPAEGEGRNAAYAVENNWAVDALDSSEKAIEKARKLVEERKIPWYNYQLVDLRTWEIIPEFYDAIGLCYVHAPTEWRRDFHQKIVSALKVNGHLILEAFSKDQLGKNSGGPKNIDQLFDLNELLEDFQGINFHLAHTAETKLREGDGHRGTASVIRLFGQKVAEI